jgi:hypothetical protein
MSTLRTLHDAFDALEHRADAALSPVPEIAAPRPARHRTRHLLAPVAAAAAVAVIAASVTVWQHARPGAPANQPAAGSAVVTTSQSASTTHPTGRFQPPKTPAELAAKTRAILAGIATIKVTDTGYPVQASVPASVPAKGNHLTPISSQSSVSAPIGRKSGSAILGTLSATGVTGGFDLNVFLASPGSKASCDEGTGCTLHDRPDGSTLAIGTWHDPSVPDGITYQVELVRPDGADILLHLSTEHNPKGGSTVTASHTPLTVDQMTDFVTSDRW